MRATFLLVWLIHWGPVPVPGYPDYATGRAEYPSRAECYQAAYEWKAGCRAHQLHCQLQCVEAPESMKRLPDGGLPPIDDGGVP